MWRRYDTIYAYTFSGICTDGPAQVRITIRSPNGWSTVKLWRSREGESSVLAQTTMSWSPDRAGQWSACGGFDDMRDNPVPGTTRCVYENYK
jgi:hypothetical protein